MRIGIVNDSTMAVEMLRRALSLRPQHEIAWVAGDGAEGVALCARDKPDLVLMDLVMPGTDGVEATRLIMSNTPCAILVVTASIGGNAWRAFDAMGHGALDAVDTPVLAGGDLQTTAAPFLQKVDTIAKLVGDAKGTKRMDGKTMPAAPALLRGNLVAIGASAGGPAALQVLLSGVPKDFPAAVVIVQHVDEQFAAGMADWLARYSYMPVRVAAEGDCPEAGTVLLAGTNDHLILKRSGLLGYTPQPEEYPYRPSVDVFFESVARHWPGKAAGVVLTGMGRDGAKGLKMLKERGHPTIAQDKSSSAVYGMPKAAAALNAAVNILPLDQIAKKLVDVFPRKDASQQSISGYA